MHYVYSNKKGRKTLVLLHGWKGNRSSFDMLAKLKREYNCLIVDLPPFGKSDEPIGWNIFSYANLILSLCEHLNISKFSVVGHSFGGRIAILLAALEPKKMESLVLTGCAGMKPKRGLKYYCKKWRYRLAKKIGRDTSRFGSKDYRTLSANMKQIFSSIVSTYLEPYAKKIKCKTLIVFGEDDMETPLYMARRLRRLIPLSKLVIMKQCSHFAFQEKPYEFCQMVDEFLKGAK